VVGFHHDNPSVYGYVVAHLEGREGMVSSWPLRPVDLFERKEINVMGVRALGESRLVVASF
jgi:hypothetical protein